MKPRHIRIATRLAVATVLLSTLGLALTAQRQAADAQATARVARTGAYLLERPAQKVRVDLSAYDAALYRVELEARRYGQCVELLWYATNAARRAWPGPPRFELPVSSCPLPAFDPIGSAREWKGVTMRPGSEVRRGP